MRAISQAFRREYIKGNRNYDIRINVRLADTTTTFTLTNEDIWEGGFSFEEAISSTNSFDVGDAIIGKCTVILDNIDERFSQYDFFNATFIVFIGLKGLDEQLMRLGTYTVDAPTYNGSLITLNCLDNMWRFDTPFSDVGFTFTQSTKARDVINAMCQYSGIGITLATQSFPNYTTLIQHAPEGDLSCREVLQYIAQICCCYCKMTPEGNLSLKWIDKSVITDITNYDGGTYNTTTTPYSDGCGLDGGHFNPWDGDSADGGLFYDSNDELGYITQNSQMQVGTDDIWITGVRVCSNDPNSENGYDVLWVDTELEQTHPRYILVIQDNPFVNPSNATTIATTLGNTISGTPLRTFNSSSLSDISIEAGDPVQINDFRGNRYYSWVTNVKFSSDNYENFSCGAISMMENKTVRYSDAIKTLVEAKRNAQEIVNTYDQAVQQLNETAINAVGKKEYVYTSGGSTTTWLYNGEDVDDTDPSYPLFPDSTVVIKTSGDGTFISRDGGTTYTEGYDANTGTIIASLLYTIGLNADWIKAGTIDADRIAANSISANKISASQLSAISATLGTVTSGEITYDNNYIRLNASGTEMSLGDGDFRLDAYGRVNCQRLAVQDEGHNDVMYFTKKHFAILGNGHSWVDVDRVLSGGSDERIKRDILPIEIEESEKFVKSFIPKKFHFIESECIEDTLHYGTIAQELEKNLKEEGIDTSNIEILHKRADGYYIVDYKEFIPHIINVVKKQESEIDELKNQIKILKERMDKLDGNTSS